MVGIVTASHANPFLSIRSILWFFKTSHPDSTFATGTPWNSFVNLLVLLSGLLAFAIHSFEIRSLFMRSVEHVQAACLLSKLVISSRSVTVATAIFIDEGLPIQSLRNTKSVKAFWYASLGDCWLGICALNCLPTNSNAQSCPSKMVLLEGFLSGTSANFFANIWFTCGEFFLQIGFDNSIYILNLI